MKPVTIITATQSDKSDFPLVKSFGKLPQCQREIIYQNKEPLAKVYNRYIKNPEYNKSILIFCHDDAVIEDLFLTEKLNEAMEHYDIVGLAGAKAPITLKQPCLWHLMGERNHLSGSVGHFTDNTMSKRFMTNFGQSPERVVLLDGVFLAINVEKVLKAGLEFDEQNPASFHFYDINFSLDANKKGLKLGTWPIWITHCSHGLEKLTEDWLKGQEYLLQKYNK